MFTEPLVHYTNVKMYLYPLHEVCIRINLSIKIKSFNKNMELMRVYAEPINKIYLYPLQGVHVYIGMSQFVGMMVFIKCFSSLWSTQLPYYFLINVINTCQNICQHHEV